MKKCKPTSIEGPEPVAYHMGSWWEDRKREIADMGRGQLESQLREAGIRVAGEDRPMLWLRWRLALANQAEALAERGLELTEGNIRASKTLDASETVPYWLVDVFYDIRARDRENEKARRELAQAKDKAASREEAEEREEARNGNEGRQASSQESRYRL
jgi:hypothetical protein